MFITFTVTVSRDITTLPDGQEAFADGDAHHTIEGYTPYGVVSRLAIRYQRFHGWRNARRYRKEMRAHGYEAHLCLGVADCLHLSLPTPEGVRG